ncbi:trypsin-like peptidase domain-containing protein [Micromonospora sp. WMMD735]|uniref:trypsin-like peptidase domain-containing protein n=1 Tax=Micromonospora sp. WMMD735 TaxID=3404130 RepID=UPI003B925BC8
MTLLLNSYPVPWDMPAFRELRDALAASVYRDRDIELITVDAGLSPGNIAWDRSARNLWFQVINEAAGCQLLPALLDRVLARQPALWTRIEELSREEPVVTAPLPAGADGVLGPSDPGWKNFGGERQIVKGQETLLDIAFLEHGLRCAPAVCRLLVTMGGAHYYGTAFRIGQRTLLTNHHVLHNWDNDDAPAASVQAAFGYELDVRGVLRKPMTIGCDPGTIRGDRTHDFAVIDVAEPLSDDIPILPIEAGASVSVDDRVYIVQHPQGLPKKIAMHHNVVRHVDADVVQYWTDTEAGSSGSPVFDEKWQVVALHHQWVEAPGDDGQAFRNQGRSIGKVVDRMGALGIDSWRS